MAVDTAAVYRTTVVKVVAINSAGGSDSCCSSSCFIGCCCFHVDCCACNRMLLAVDSIKSWMWVQRCSLHNQDCRERESLAC